MSGERLSRDGAPCGPEYPTIGKRQFVVCISSISVTDRQLTFRPSGFLVSFESELLKRAHKNFSFLNGRSAIKPSSVSIE